MAAPRRFVVHQSVEFVVKSRFTRLTTGKWFRMGTPSVCSGTYALEDITVKRLLHSLLLLALLASPVLAEDRVENQVGGSETPRTGKLTGRFVFDGEPPPRAPIRVSTERGTRAGDDYQDLDAQRFAKFKLTDETLIVGPDRGIQNILIWIFDKSVPVPPVPLVRRLPQPATLTFDQGRLQPHVLAWWAGHRALELKNADEYVTNFRWDSIGANTINQSLGPNHSEKFQTLPERMPSRMKSDIYAWLQPAIVFPCAHPYFAVTDAEGYFTMSDLPAGEWEFRIWHERCGWINTAGWPKGRSKHRIGDKVLDLGSIKIKPEVLQIKGEPPAAPASTTSATSARPAADSPRKGWKELGEQRRTAHERDGGKEWVGTWIMHLPAGFEHQIRIVETECGILKFAADKNLNSLGTYALIKNQLLLVKPNDASDTDDFIWQLNDEGQFVLITDKNRAGARYIGAVLEKVKQ